MADKAYYADELFRLIKEAEADGYWIDADWEEIRIGKPGEMYSKAEVIGFNWTGHDTGWERGK